LLKLDTSLKFLSSASYSPRLLFPSTPSTAAEEKKAEKGPEKLAHSLDILEAFATLQLEVPLYKDKVAELVPLVAAKKEHFLAK